MKKQKFEGNGRELWIPDNCYYFDLGESYDFAGTFEQFCRDHFNVDMDAVIEKLSDPKYRTALGACETFTSPCRVEKYAASTYRPKDWNFGEGIEGLAGCWFGRAHEEGHALIYFGLKDEVKKIVGEADYSDEQAVCDLLGLHAIDAKGLGHLISSENREYNERARRWYFERARRWAQYRKEAEEIHREAEKKGGITNVLSVGDIVEARKELERR